MYGNWSVIVCVVLCVLRSGCSTLHPRPTAVPLVQPLQHTRTTTRTSQLGLYYRSLYPSDLPLTPSDLPPTPSDLPPSPSDLPPTQSSRRLSFATVTPESSKAPKSGTPSESSLALLPALTSAIPPPGPSLALSSTLAPTWYDPRAGRTQHHQPLPFHTTLTTPACPRSSTWDKPLCVEQPPGPTTRPSGHIHLNDLIRSRSGSLSSGETVDLKLKPLIELLQTTSTTLKDHVVSKTPQLRIVYDSPPPTNWSFNCSEATHLVTCKDASFYQNLPGNNSDTDLEDPSSLPDQTGRLQNLSSSPCVIPGNTSSKARVSCSHKGSSGTSTASSLMANEWARIVGYSLIFLVGVVGNVLVVVTLLHHRNLRTVTNVFLLNLAVSDLLLGVFCMPFTLVGSLLQDFVFGALMCRLIPYIQAVSVTVSVWTLVAISLERFYAICQPLRSRRWQTPAHSYRVLVGVWAASLCFMTPIAALSTLMPVKGDPGRHKCREVWPSLAAERVFTILLTVTLLLVPLVVMGTAYLSVVRTLWLGAEMVQPGSGKRKSALQTCSSNCVTPPPNTRISIRFRRIPTISRDGVRYECGAHCPPAGGEGPDLSLLQESRQNSENRSLNGDLEVLPTRSPESQGSFLRRDPEERKTSKGGRWRNDNASGSCGLLRSSHTERSLQAKRRVVRMLFVLVAEFFICWTPLFIVNLLSLYIPRQVYAALGSFGVSLVQLLAYLSSCCNPITYCFMNANFIQSFKQTFGCTRRGSRSSRYGNDSSFRSGVFCQLPLRVNVDRSLSPFPRSQQSFYLNRTTSIDNQHNFRRRPSGYYSPRRLASTRIRTSSIGTEGPPIDSVCVDEAVTSSF